MTRLVPIGTPATLERDLGPALGALVGTLLEQNAEPSANSIILSLIRRVACKQHSRSAELAFCRRS